MIYPTDSFICKHKQCYWSVHPAYLLMNMDIWLVRWATCGVPAQKLHVFEDLLDWETKGNKKQGSDIIYWPLLTLITVINVYCIKRSSARLKYSHTQPTYIVPPWCSNTPCQYALCHLWCEITTQTSSSLQCFCPPASQSEHQLLWRDNKQLTNIWNAIYYTNL